MKTIFNNSSLKKKLIILIILPMLGYLLSSLYIFNLNIEKYNQYNNLYEYLENGNNLNAENKVNQLLIALSQNEKSELNKTLVNKIEETKNELILGSIVFILISFITLIFLNAIIKYIVGSLFKINEGLEKFFRYLTSTEKNLDVIDINTNDDFGRMAKNLNFNIEKIKDGLAIDNEVINEAKFVSKMVGKGFLVYRINSVANNEYINQLKDNFNNMIDSLRVNIVNSFKTSLDYANRDFTVKADKTDIGAIVNTQLRCLNMIGMNISEFLAMVNKNGNILDDKSNELLNLVKKLHNSSINQASSLEETTAAVTMITQSITSTSTKASNMLDIANSTKNYSLEGIKLVEVTQKSMYEINESTQAINEAITIIDQIAFQTNILSLNAAVEAATAGEAGKGFAVVAQEVRNLANRSAEAAKVIKNLVEVANIKSEDGKKYSEQMKTSFEKLSSMIEENTGIIDDVAKSNEKQMINLSQINETMNNLDKLTQENASMATQTKDVALETSSVAQDMLKAASLNEYDLEVEKRIKNFSFTQKLNSAKIEYTKYKQAILNQINNKSNSIDINVEHRQNIYSFLDEYKDNGLILVNDFEELKSLTTKLDESLINYGEAIKQRNEKNILSLSIIVEGILDNIFDLLNKMKEVN
ncbi:methyl-accepting chemotaxis protein [Arcobacter roscoffensis]|uniref:Methyl-accepting chemotaxis protein n=1 Tax=Arcobacter roscoffensis TaxID=2961520 RepID=A0ABY5E257_9BACT|nr:methyl-accepting chemotaxis protein [Arcobacter roscoffensis]UTJ06274.1 methyl-accepting chemotaxis protein [Arcobacter roscoffensis]